MINPRGVYVMLNPFRYGAYNQTEFVEGEEHEHSITSRINLVDLAGSERSNSAQTSGDRLRVHTPPMTLQNSSLGPHISFF